MQWTVDSVSRKTSGYGDSLKTIGYNIIATRHTEMGEHKVEVVVPLHMSHPLVGDILTTEISWGTLDELVIATDELEDARLEEAQRVE